MAGVFTGLFLIVAAGLVVGVRGYVRLGRRRSQLLDPYLPFLLVVLVLSALLLVKFAYDEIYPCVAVDDFSCHFDITQYHNLFGWEF